MRAAQDLENTTRTSYGNSSLETMRSLARRECKGPAEARLLSSDVEVWVVGLLSCSQDRQSAQFYHVPVHDQRGLTPTCKQSGIAKLRLIDFDQVTLSSLNRHATATRADVGIPKVLSVQRFLHSVVPWVHVDARNDLWNIQLEQLNHWLDGADWVVDAIDNISTKVRIK